MLTGIYFKGFSGSTLIKISKLFQYFDSSHQSKDDAVNCYVWFINNFFTWHYKFRLKIRFWRVWAHMVHYCVRIQKYLAQGHWVGNTLATVIILDFYSFLFAFVFLFIFIFHILCRLVHWYMYHDDSFALIISPRISKVSFSLLAHSILY